MCVFEVRLGLEQQGVAMLAPNSGDSSVLRWLLPVSCDFFVGFFQGEDFARMRVLEALVIAVASPLQHVRPFQCPVFNLAIAMCHAELNREFVLIAFD